MLNGHLLHRILVRLLYQLFQRIHQHFQIKSVFGQTRYSGTTFEKNDRRRLPRKYVTCKDSFKESKEIIERVV